MSSQRAVMFRLLHDNPAGTKLLAAATSTNETLTATREAQATFLECRNFFDTDITDVFPSSGKDDEANSFAAWTKELGSKCTLFSFVASDENLGEGNGKLAVGSFLKLCAKWMPELQNLLAGRVFEFLEKLKGENIINVTDASWVAVTQEVPFLLQHTLLFCKDGPIHLLLERIKKVQAVAELEALQQSVDCCLALATTAAWSKF